MQVLWFLGLFFITTNLCADTKAMDGKSTMMVGGFSRTYRYHVPSMKSSEEPVPLVFFLHGMGSNCERSTKLFGWTEKSDKEKFIIVYPEALPLDHSKKADPHSNPSLWNDGSHPTNSQINDIGFLRALYNDFVKHYTIDKKKVFCTGFSNGGSMSFRAGIALSDIFEAIAPVSGDLSIKNFNGARPISMLLIVGSADPIVPLEGGTYKTSRGTCTIAPLFESVEKWIHLIKTSETDKTMEKIGNATITTYGPGATGKVAIFVVIEGGDHDWPGAGQSDASFNATDYIWDFFKKQ